MKPSKDHLKNNEFIKLKDKDWLDKQRVSGKVTADTLSMLENHVKDKSKLSLLELDKIAENYILSQKCIPTFLGYNGFPNACCISVNNQLVHGIPTDYVLQDGDVVTFDLGATFEGVISDSALTCIYGEPKKQEHVKMVNACEEALFKGLSAIKVGSHLGVIGNAIYRSAKGNGFNVIENYGGHGIDISDSGEGIPHAAPFVGNKASPDEGIRIQPGLTIAIEPLLCFGSTSTRVSSDGWTVVMDGVCVHTEHSIYVHQDHVEILTWRENEKYLKTNKLYFDGG